MAPASAQRWLAVVCALAAVTGAAAVCAGLPAVVIDASWPASCKGAATGVTCTAVCNPERGGPSPTISQCNADGSWSPPTGSGCKRVCVGQPPAVAGVDWSSCIGTIVVGKTCSGRCSGGTPFGSPSIYCGNSGWDSQTLAGRCSATPVCSEPFPALLNGRWPRECRDTASGQNCGAICNAGYGPGASASCQNGVWSAVTGACSQVCAGAPPAINNAVWPPSCTGGTPVNARCQGTCASGSSGSPSIRCVASGWDVASATGRCVAGPVCATIPPTTPNAQWPTSCMDTAVGGSCTATCRTNYGPGASATCSSGGTWTVSGACYKVCATTPPAVTNVNWAACAGTKTGNRCSGSCVAGTSGSPSMLCSGNGWRVDTLVGACNAGSVCTGPVPTVTNGRFPSSCQDAVSGTTCAAACNPNYGPGASTTCQGGQWSPVTGVCKRVCQGTPSPVANVNWAACTGSTGVNTRCTGQCTSGSGSPSVMCASMFGAEPAWDMSTLQGACRTGGSCSAPFPTLVNGQWPTSCLDSAVGSSCTAVCNPGYANPGATTSCTASGWSAVTGACGRQA